MLNAGDLFICTYFGFNLILVTRYIYSITSSHDSVCSLAFASLSNILKYSPNSGLLGPLKIVIQNIGSLPSPLITSSTANLKFIFTTFLNSRQYNICFRFSFLASHNLQLTFMYPLFPARPILSHLILAHCSLSLSFATFSLQYFSYPTIFFHSLYSGQYLNVSIRYQSSCVVWSSIMLQH